MAPFFPALGGKQPFHGGRHLPDDDLSSNLPLQFLLFFAAQAEEQFSEIQLKPFTL